MKLGERVTYTDPKGRTIEGVLVATRLPGSVIQDIRTGERWRAIQFQVQPDRGRAVWTTSFPDKTEPRC